MPTATCLQIHISAKEVARRSDMPCIVDGPVLRELCNTLFTHPNMQKAFRDVEHEQDQVRQILNLDVSRFPWTRNISLNFVYWPAIPRA